MSPDATAPPEIPAALFDCSVRFGIGLATEP